MTKEAAGKNVTRVEDTHGYRTFQKPPWVEVVIAADRKNNLKGYPTLQHEGCGGSINWQTSLPPEGRPRGGYIWYQCLGCGETETIQQN